MTSAALRLLPSRHAAQPGAASPSWPETIDERLVCVEVEQETHDVATFVLRSRESTRFWFDAGQYVTVTVEVDGRQVSRCYTIASPPTRPESLRLTVKRVPGGPVSNWLHDHLRPGGTVLVSGPVGQFTSTSRPVAKHLFLSGGSGITPLMSMTRA